MGNARVWIFRFLILAVSAFLVWTWLQPWWELYIREASFYMQIRPWGLSHNLGNYIVYLPGAEMPAFFAPIMWTYLGLAVAALFYSMFVKDKKFNIWKLRFNLPTFIIGLVGISYIVVVITAVIVAYIRTADFGVLLIGHTYIELGEFPVGANGIADLQQGYWMACAAGPLLLILAILRNIIIGRKKGQIE
ncbi:MAG: hypothetical protein PHF74_04730 [Dehalococcoidales bacterium]|nr:hypothetical protein [Dehalococcoidales bacterium]